MAPKRMISDEQKKALDEASVEPAVPPMEQLIAQAVANNSKEIELQREIDILHKRCTSLRADAAAEKCKTAQMVERLLVEKGSHNDTLMKLVDALEKIAELTPANLREDYR